MTTPLRVAALAAAGCAACAACTFERPGAAAAADSAATVRMAAVVVLADTTAADRTVARPTPDSAAGRIVGDAPRRSARGDTTPVAVTDSELRELAAAIAIPVQGVRRADLRDSYTEPRGQRVHHALDIHAPRGTPVVAAVDGRLLKLHNSRAGGLMVYAADASDRFVLMYGHLDRYADGLREGMPLRRGQVIGYVGTTGNAPPGTPHLHFVVSRGRPSASWWRGTPVNPYPLLVGAGP